MIHIYHVFQLDWCIGENTYIGSVSTIPTQRKLYKSISISKVLVQFIPNKFR